MFRHTNIKQTDLQRTDVIFGGLHISASLGGILSPELFRGAILIFRANTSHHGGVSYGKTYLVSPPLL